MSDGLGDRIAAADAARDARAWKRAARLYGAALELDPARDDLWIQRGHALKESGDFDAAEESYRRALDLRPTVADSWMQLGHLMSLRDRVDAAAEAYARAVARDTTMTDAVQGLRAAVARGAVLPDELRRETARALRPPSRRTRLMSADATALARVFGEALDALGDDAPSDAVEAVRAGLAALPALSPPEAEGPVAVFDVSDLIGYFAHSRLPTGIQRVQIEVLSALLTDPATEPRCRVCAFEESRDAWVEIPPDLFLDVAGAALEGADLAEAGWRVRLDAVRTELTLAPTLAFPPGAWLINLGTSWWLQNYFLKVREAKRRFGVRYVPFVHDMIPVMAPEHCVQPLVRDFVSWALGVFAHADAFLTNSEASRDDLMSVAARLGVDVTADRVRVVRLDADFRKAGATSASDDAVLERNRLTPGGFMLFVSTLESRKNHVEVLAALQRMLASHGPQRTPKLVCVGGRGWLNDAVFARLRSDPALARHVVILSGVPDADLDRLYRSCLFTLYPSLYEGWGLPVTEALCHGKVVLASNRSSVPEAGGDLAVYFQPGDLNGLTEAMERLTFDGDWRELLERRIRDRFRPRPWAELGGDMLAAVDGWATGDDAAGQGWPLALAGRLHRLGRSMALGIGRGDRADEIFREGAGWAPPEPWGCRARSGAELVFRIDLAEGTPLRLHVGLHAPGEGRACELRLADDRAWAGHVLGSAVRWVVLEAAAPGPDKPIRLSFAAAPDGRPPHPGERVDVGVIGFMACAADDLSARADFQAGIASGGWGLQPPEGLQA
ncbi:MAG TPA: glycosyltransferase [Brevundimonas sp.]|uniref:glycosyltransferase n=1 Tax=Brevundimonas sp. TaxID=1871086 RepID=UPI002DF1BBE2|nr:glycosyltransferase [Brevundimonas sp.]